MKRLKIEKYSKGKVEYNNKPLIRSVVTKIVKLNGILEVRGVYVWDSLTKNTKAISFMAFRVYGF